MEDDFEYHVAFSPAKSSDEDLDKLSLKLSYEKGEPVVVLLGWLGCKNRYLAKYSDFYEKSGCTVVRYIAPPNFILSQDPRQKLTPHAQKLIGVLHDYSLTDQPFVFHVFSNGGAMMYDLISNELLKEENSKIKIVGCIFDSCPGKTSLAGLAKALSVQQPGGAARKFFISWIMAIFFYVSFYVKWFVSFATGNRMERFRTTLWSRLLEEPRNHPQLFLCSQADKVICDTHILDFMTLREQNGVNVSSVVWQDSDHVALFKDHPESYTTHCIEFIRHCLSLEEEEGEKNRKEEQKKSEM